MLTVRVGCRRYGYTWQAVGKYEEAGDHAIRCFDYYLQHSGSEDTDVLTRLGNLQVNNVGSVARSMFAVGLAFCFTPRVVRLSVYPLHHTTVVGVKIDALGVKSSICPFDLLVDITGG